MTFSDLIKEVTEETISAAIKAAGLALTPVLNFEALPPNSVVRTIALSILPKGLLSFVQVQQMAIRGGFLDWAEPGTWLERLGEQVYGVPRIQATFASTEVTFTNTSGNLYVFSDGQVVVAHATTGKTYRASGIDVNGDPFELQPSPGPGNVKTVDVIAEEAGTDSNAAAGEITTMVTVFDGVTCTNPSAASGTDLEDPNAYRARCKQSLAATSPMGAADAYRFVATSALRDDGTAIGITKVTVVDDTINNTVEVFVATASGTPPLADIQRIQDLMLGLATDEFAVLPNGNSTACVPHGVNFLGVTGAAEVIVPVTYSGTALTSVGLSVSEIEDLVEDALIALFADAVHNPIGGQSGIFYASKMRATIEQVRAEPGDPEPFIDVTLSAPNVNVVLGAGDVAVLGTITPTVNLV